MWTYSFVEFFDNLSDHSIGLFETEVKQDALPHIGEAIALLEITAILNRRRIDEQGDFLAGMVGAVEGRIVAMVGGDHEDIVGPHRFDKLANPDIERFESVGITRSISPMAILRIELDQVNI